MLFHGKNSRERKEIAMRRNRKNNAKKERIIMFASSAFVLAALTMTGIYMKSRNAESENDGYTIDFTAIEDNTEEKYQEIAQNTETDSLDMQETLEDDLDYVPMEAGSSLIEIPGLTDDGVQEAEQLPNTTHMSEMTELPKTEQPKTDLPMEELPEVDLAEAEDKLQEETQEEEQEQTEEKRETAAQDVVVVKELSFSEEEGLLRPVSGETLIPYSMNAGTYFATLDQYKYNPALMLSAVEGSAVCACAEGRVINIFENEEIGHAITMDLGNGYELTYGQLDNICVALNSYVNPGEQIASVAAPTKYYSVEGSNLYLELKKDGKPLNPESLF